MVIRLSLLVAVISIVHGGYYGPTQSPTQTFIVGNGANQGYPFSGPINYANVVTPGQPPARLPVNGFG